MKIYFLVPSKENLPKNEMNRLEKSFDEVVVIEHIGKAADKEIIELLKEDKSEKILALDPATFDWNFDAESLKEVSNIVAVCPSTTSFDWIKPKLLAQMKIIGCNCPGFSSDSVAEYIVCMAMETARKMPTVIKNGWSLPFSDRGMLLKGKTAGIIGLGRIGTRVGEILTGIGMNVVYWSKKSTDKRFTKIELDELFKSVDLLIPALVENKETKDLISNKRIDSMKSHSIIVGINRVKDLWDEDYVIKKVENGKLGGYAYEGENRKELEQYKGNVWALPPIAWQTQESLDTLMKIWADNMIAISKNMPQNVIT